MRKIKFRIWNKETNRWLLLYPTISDLEDSAYLCGTGKVAFRNHFWYNDNQNNYVVQMFTGLIDSNGNEIYEGDVIKEHHYEDWGDKDGFTYIGVIEWVNNMVSFRSFPYPRTSHQWNGHPIMFETKCEVIGNVFEYKK